MASAEKVVIEEPQSTSPDMAIMGAGEKLADGAPPLTVAQVDRVVAALRTSSGESEEQLAA